MKKITQIIKNHYRKLFLGGALALFSMPSLAVIDVGPAAAAITADGTAALTVIGTALLGLASVALVFRWAKAANVLIFNLFRVGYLYVSRETFFI